MNSPVILSVFPGIDLLGRAFEEVFPECCLVRGPDVLWGGDVRHFHPPSGVFWGVIGGPPCQCFSRLRYLVLANGYELKENMIPEFERVVAEAQPEWFLMENVPQAPTPIVDGYVVHRLVYNNRWAGGEQHRERHFSFGTRDGRQITPDESLFEHANWAPAVLAHGGCRPTPVKIGGNGKVKATAARNIGYQSAAYFREACRLQGLPDDFDLPPFLVVEKVRAVGNGVPLPMGRAIAKAVKAAMEVR